MGNSGGGSGKSGRGAKASAAELERARSAEDDRNSEQLRNNKDAIGAWIGGIVPARDLVSNAAAWAKGLADLSPERREIAIALIHLFSTEKKDALGNHLEVTNDRLRQLAHWVGDKCYDADLMPPLEHFTTPPTCIVRTRYLELLWPSRSFQPFQDVSDEAAAALRGKADQFSDLLVALEFPTATHPEASVSGWTQLKLVFVRPDGSFAARRATIAEDGGIDVGGGREAMGAVSRAQLERMERQLMDDAAARKLLLQSEAADPEFKRKSAFAYNNSGLKRVTAPPTPCRDGVNVRSRSGDDNAFDPDCMAAGWMAALRVPAWAIEAARGKKWDEGSGGGSSSGSGGGSGGDTKIDEDRGVGAVRAAMVNAATKLMEQKYILSRDVPADALLRNARRIAWLVRWLGSSAAPVYGRRLHSVTYRWFDPRFDPWALARTTPHAKSHDVLSDTYPGGYVLGYTTPLLSKDHVSFA